MPSNYFIYQAPELNRIPNDFYIAGNGLPRESYFSTPTYSYRITGNSWEDLRISSNSGNATPSVNLVNGLTGAPSYSLSRIGMQFTSISWGLVPAGIQITSFMDAGVNFPFKIRAFKGTTSPLVGDVSEFGIPFSEGLIPYSPEIEMTATGDAVLYFYQNVVDDFIVNSNQSVFILGEYDYNGIEPTAFYQLLNNTSGDFMLTGQE